MHYTRSCPVYHSKKALLQPFEAPACCDWTMGTAPAAFLGAVLCSEGSHVQRWFVGMPSMTPCLCMPLRRVRAAKNTRGALTSQTTWPGHSDGRILGSTWLSVGGVGVGK